MPVPVSIPIKTADIFDRVRLPTSSSGFDRIFRASTTRLVRPRHFPSICRIHQGDWPGSVRVGV
ncbi:hypothetical protein PGT21_012204 [Puccinia graminis f. sp. tritici]|uniref:Uncharacterized protein n=1 Tax=Puccinia graminis f. sp. tritici TaxID=56615 RepID=A0A5B0N8J5_PUCGR|nr:hypothetical protein PGT21_012204 [Puccinia graminis f. sp. tritici]KAA1135996.1 hypothetical protein PGTUg99_019388 [Puccinia graminis f. sp. tritici]